MTATSKSEPTAYILLTCCGDSRAHAEPRNWRVGAVTDSYVNAVSAGRTRSMGSDPSAWCVYFWSRHEGLRPVAASEEYDTLVEAGFLTSVPARMEPYRYWAAVESAARLMVDLATPPPLETHGQRPADQQRPAPGDAVSPDDPGWEEGETGVTL